MATSTSEAGGTGRKTLKCIIRSRQRQGSKVFEGEVTIPGLTTAKLTQVRTQEPYYTTSNAVRQAARAFASRWNADIEVEDTTKAKVEAEGEQQGTRGRGRTTTRSTKKGSTELATANS